MGRRLGTALFLAVLCAALPRPASADEPSADATTVVFERPPEGPRRGLVTVPSPVVYGITAVAVIASFGYLVRRVRRPS
jgi:hypothetical protein